MPWASDEFWFVLVRVFITLLLISLWPAIARPCSFFLWLANLGLHLSCLDPLRNKPPGALKLPHQHPHLPSQQSLPNEIQATDSPSGHSANGSSRDQILAGPTTSFNLHFHPFKLALAFPSTNAHQPHTPAASL